MGGGGDELLLLIVAAYLAASPSRPHFCRIAATNPNWGEGGKQANQVFFSFLSPIYLEKRERAGLFFGSKIRL